MSQIHNNVHMINEIKQQTELFRHILARRKQYTKEFVELFQTKQVQEIIFIGSGSPSHVSQTLKYAAISVLNVRATAPLPSLFVHHEGKSIIDHSCPGKTILICPVESGRTKGPVFAAQMAKAANIPIVCTTLDEHSSLAKLADVVIKKPSGEEIAPPSTKGHSTGLLLLLLCFLDAARATGRLQPVQLDAYEQAIADLPDRVANTTQYVQSWFSEHRDDVVKAPNYWFLAYGSNVGTATEAVLKFIESHQKPTFAYELEEFLHGPLCAVKKNDIVFFLATEEGPEKQRMLELYDAMKPDYPYCTLVHPQGDTGRDTWDLPIDAGNMPFFDALDYLIPVQVLSYEIADALGIDVTVWTTTAIRQKLKPGFER